MRDTYAKNSYVCKGNNEQGRPTATIAISVENLQVVDSEDMAEVYHPPR